MLSVDTENPAKGGVECVNLFVKVQRLILMEEKCADIDGTY
jgi:hypothetical protein